MRPRPLRPGPAPVSRLGVSPPRGDLVLMRLPVVALTRRAPDPDAGLRPSLAFQRK